MTRRLLLIAAIASGWLAALVLYIYDDDQIEQAWQRGYDVGLGEGNDRDTGPETWDPRVTGNGAVA